MKACRKAYDKGMKNLKIILAGFPENISNEEMQEMIKENNLEDKIEKIFKLLKKWNKYPKYQLERRLDIFFTIYLPEILKEK